MDLTNPPNSARAGGPLSPRPLRWLADSLRGFLQLRGSGAIVLKEAGSGPQLSDSTPERFTARLVGGGNPYGIVEVYDTPGGTWGDLPGGRACDACCWDRNNLTGLGAKVVQVEQVVAGEYRSIFRRLHTSAGPTCTLQGTVLSCTKLDLSRWAYPGGATIVLKQGALTVATTTSDGAGHFTFTGVPVGTGYTFTATALTQPARFQITTTASFTVSCSSGAPQVQNITLLVAAGYVCTACSPYPWPTTLHWTDKYGNVTIVYDPASPAMDPIWRGCEVTNIPCAYVFDGMICDGPVAGATGLNYALHPNQFVGVATMAFSAPDPNVCGVPETPSDCAAGPVHMTNFGSGSLSCPATVPVNVVGTITPVGPSPYASPASTPAGCNSGGAGSTGTSSAFALTE